MATRDQAVTDVPAILSGTVDSTDYTVQNGGIQKLLIATATAAPDAGDARWRLTPGADISIKALAGENIYVWCPLGRATVATYDEAS